MTGSPTAKPAARRQPRLERGERNGVAPRGVAVICTGTWQRAGRGGRLQSPLSREPLGGVERRGGSRGGQEKRRGGQGRAGEKSCNAPGWSVSISMEHSPIATRLRGRREERRENRRGEGRERGVGGQGRGERKYERGEGMTWHRHRPGHRSERRPLPS